MDRPIHSTALAAIVLLLLCGRAFALGGDHPADRPLPKQPDWPKGLHETLATDGRVHGFFVNANDYFFYSGNAKRFNKFLACLAESKAKPITLKLHKGVGSARSPWAREKAKRCDWQINVLRRGWHPDAPEGKKPDKAGYVFVVELWCDGKVSVKDIKIPPGLAVKADAGIKLPQK